MVGFGLVTTYMCELMNTIKFEFYLPNLANPYFISCKHENILKSMECSPSTFSLMFSPLLKEFRFFIFKSGPPFIIGAMYLF